ncbi:hypothetical protein VTK73DRAFT_6558 [Phialemonium thermophilum]|uniref:Fibronectin type-III domain-containing protein n=1 Tax=Phialemonium thermophilum TaxID=223376 RepID=A0ABR3XVF2_9PEZI
MSCSAYAPLIPTALIISAVLAWWFTEPKNARLNLIAAVGVVLFCWTVTPDLSRGISLSLSSSSFDPAAAIRLHLLLVSHANMLLTGAAVVWLLRRAWQTLWKPVPELINILGVDVPDAPDVSLAGIRADAATVNWTRPSPNRPVQKFLIQVNGVVVGDVAANQEPAIVVSGLKPNHFYNVRVIAVGSNNFQAGSRVIRLRTFGSDGRPQLGTSRLPPNFISHDYPGSVQGERVDEVGVLKSNIPAVENVTTSDAAALPLLREGSGAVGSRRSTITRRHSPSTTSIDLPPCHDDAGGEIEQTLPELTGRFESIRKETEEIAALIAREESENKRHMEELEEEKRKKRKEQKKKEEQTEKLKREVNSTDRVMRNAMQRKNQKEKLLKDKQNERTRYQDNIAKWERDIADMRRERDSFDHQKRDLEIERDKKIESFRQINDELQQECGRLEMELREKREQVKALEDARKRLPGGEDDSEWREKDVELKRDCQRRQRELHEILVQENKLSRRLDEQLRILSIQVGHIPGVQPGYGMYTQANSSGLDFDNNSLNQLKRRSRNSNSLSNISMSSPLPPYSQIDPAIPGPPGFSVSRANTNPTFAQGPFMDLSADMPARLDEAGIRASSAPLSPSATALLPSNILDDLGDDDSPTSRFDPEFFPTHTGSPDNDPQSPASSDPSMSIPMSSPHGSSHNLPFPALSIDTSDRRSLKATDTLPSPISPVPSTSKLSHFFHFQRARNGKDGSDESGPVLGSLKSGQSQSFPRQTDDEPGSSFSNKRRTSLSGTWNVFNRNSTGTGAMENYPSSGLRGFSVRTLNPFSSSNRGPDRMFADRHPSSPRPASIASSDFPRPSTDGGSIWGPLALEGASLSKQSRIWSPDASWSRNPSRRTSLHGSPAALKTTLASAEDEILDETLPNVNRVGVIGSRPPPGSKSFARLNPNAPAFIGSFFKPRPDRDRDTSKEKERTKGKDKDKSRSTSNSDPPSAPPAESESPSESRKSRDGLSVCTQTSISESRESLSLEQPLSNTLSEPASVGLSSSFKDENVVRKLFRKGSSSKFSLTGRLGGKDGSSLFKKGPGSATSAGNSDKGMAADRSSIGELEESNSREEGASSLLARSYESGSGSPGLGPTLSNPKPAKDNKTGGARWLSFSKKGKKEKESLDLEREKTPETEAGAADEHSRS